jgi:hypothetical protein
MIGHNKYTLTLEQPETGDMPSRHRLCLNFDEIKSVFPCVAANNNGSATAQKSLVLKLVIAAGVMGFLSLLYFF